MYLRKYESFTALWLITAEEKGLSGIYNSISKQGSMLLENDFEEGPDSLFTATLNWLDIYFGGGVPDFVPDLDLQNLSPFRKAVCQSMLKIPYGELRTYGDIAVEMAAESGKKTMSAQAVGGAVGANPISIIIPCHRVMGAGNKLTGYGGGLYTKQALLKLEGHDVSRFIMPRKSPFLW